MAIKFKVVDHEQRRQEIRDMVKRSTNGTPEDRARTSVELARANGVAENRIIHNNDELMSFFMGK